MKTTVCLETSVITIDIFNLRIYLIIIELGASALSFPVLFFRFVCSNVSILWLSGFAWPVLLSTVSSISIVQCILVILLFKLLKGVYLLLLKIFIGSIFDRTFSSTFDGVSVYIVHVISYI